MVAQMTRRLKEQKESPIESFDVATERTEFEKALVPFLGIGPIAIEDVIVQTITHPTSDINEEIWEIQFYFKFSRKFWKFVFKDNPKYDYRKSDGENFAWRFDQITEAEYNDFISGLPSVYTSSVKTVNFSDLVSNFDGSIDQEVMHSHPTTFVTSENQSRDVATKQVFMQPIAIGKKEDIPKGALVLRLDSRATRLPAPMPANPSAAGQGHESLPKAVNLRPRTQKPDLIDFDCPGCGKTTLLFKRHCKGIRRKCISGCGALFLSPTQEDIAGL